MRKALVLGLSFSCLFFLGCGSINAIMQSWEGGHFGNLIAAWGPPQQVFDDGRGGRIFVCASNRRWTAPAQTHTQVNGSYGYGNINAYATTTYQPPENYGYTAYRMFWIGGDGIIYRWAWKGL